MPIVDADDACRRALELHGVGRFREAEAVCRAALAEAGEARDARAGDLLTLLGAILRETERTDEALVACEKAVALQPDSPATLTIFGDVLLDLRRMDDAIAAYDAALAHRPTFAPQVYLNKASALLTLGRLAEGWAEFEHRMPLMAEASTESRIGRPRWDGSPLHGKTILLWGEQGFGDTIQFARYAKVVAEQRGGRVLIAAQPPLQELLRTAAGVSGEAHWDRLSEVHVQCPLMSVPQVTKTSGEIAGIPRNVPYLRVDPRRANEWRQRLGPRDGRLRVGLAASVRRDDFDGLRRSLDSSALAPLLGIAGVQFYNLQKDSPAPGTIDRTAELRDFADTAALLAELDLVITVDTAVCHLAGALAKPVWTMLPYSANWRWFLDRDDSPWYPTMRLFRQPRRGTWETVIEAVTRELRAKLS